MANRLSVRCVPFSEATFEEAIRQASGLTSGNCPVQVQYLISYLQRREADAKTLIIETPYVDRHYLEEYTGYYANSLRPPIATTTPASIFV